MPVLTFPGVAGKLPAEVRMVLSGRSVPGQDIAGSWTDFGDGLVPGLMDRAVLNAKVSDVLAKSQGLQQTMAIQDLCKAAGLDAGATKVLLARVATTLQKSAAVEGGKKDPESPPQNPTPKMRAFALEHGALRFGLKKSMAGMPCDVFLQFPDLHLAALKLERLNLEAAREQRQAWSDLRAKRESMIPKDYEDACEALYKREDARSAAYRSARDSLELALLKRKEGEAEKRLASAPPAVPESVSAFELQEGEIELPDWLGADLYEAQEANLIKGAGHKYIRRVPTGTPGRYRYVYNRITAANGQAVPDHALVAGAKFSGKDGSKKGHFQIHKVVGDKVHISHDESGLSAVVDKATFRTMIHKQHAKAIKAEHAEKGLKSIGTTSSGKHVFAPGADVLTRIQAHRDNVADGKDASASKMAGEKAILGHLALHDGFSKKDHAEAAAIIQKHGGDKAHDLVAKAHKTAGKVPTLAEDIQAKHDGKKVAHPSKMVSKDAKGRHIQTHDAAGQKLPKPKLYASKQDAVEAVTKQVEAHRAKLGMSNLKGEPNAGVEATHGKTSEDAASKGSKRSHLAEAIGKVVGSAALGQEDPVSSSKTLGHGAARDLKDAKMVRDAKDAKKGSKMHKSLSDLVDNGVISLKDGRWVSNPEALRKAEGGSHKYISRKMGADGSWTYSYPSDAPHRAILQPAEAGALAKPLQAHVLANPHDEQKGPTPEHRALSKLQQTAEHHGHVAFTPDEHAAVAKHGLGMHGHQSEWEAEHEVHFAAGEPPHLAEARRVLANRDARHSGLSKLGIESMKKGMAWEAGEAPFDFEALEKSQGEGSKGGVVIGHTGSGKAIYKPSNEHMAAMREHVNLQKNTAQGKLDEHAHGHVRSHAKDYSPEDHKAAAEAHAKEGASLKNSEKERAFHKAIAHAHSEKAAGRDTPAMQTAKRLQAAAEKREANAAKKEAARVKQTVATAPGGHQIKNTHHIRNSSGFGPELLPGQAAGQGGKFGLKHPAIETEDGPHLSAEQHKDIAAHHNDQAHHFAVKANDKANSPATRIDHRKTMEQHQFGAKHHLEQAKKKEAAANPPNPNQGELFGKSSNMETKMKNDDALAGLDQLIKSGTSWADVTSGASGEAGSTDALEPSPGRTAPAPAKGGGSVERPHQGAIDAPAVPLGSLEASQKAINVVHLGGADEVFSKWAETQLGASSTSLDFSDWQSPQHGGGSSLSLALQATPPPVNNDLVLKKGEDEDEEEDDKEDMELSLVNEPKQGEPMAKSRAVSVTPNGMTLRVSNDVDRRAQDLIKSRNAGNFVEFSAAEQLTKSFGSRAQVMPLGNPVRQDPLINSFMVTDDPFVDV